MIRQPICAVCGFLENCDFKVMDDAWKTIVPIEYRNQIVCVKCFEDFASAKQIELLRQTACLNSADSRMARASKTVMTQGKSHEFVFSSSKT